MKNLYLVTDGPVWFINSYAVFKHSGSRISEYDFNGQFTIIDTPLGLEFESTPPCTGFSNVHMAL